MKTNLEAKAKELAAPPLLLNLCEVALMMSVSVRYLRLLGRRGDIPLVRLGRRVLVRRTDIDALIARGGLTEAP
jgi:excisionase family DNA binding protein